MKKLNWFGAMILIIMASSCNNNNTSKIEGGSNDLNFITNINDGSVTVNTGDYNFSLEYDNNSQWGTISVENLILNNNSYSFQTVSQNYIASLNFQEAYFKDVTSNTQTLTNANFLVTPFAYILGLNNGQIGTGVAGQDIVVGQYTLNNTYQVKTFFRSTVFVGETNTTYPYQGDTENYSSSNIYYNLVLTFDDNGKLTGKIIMYNAKFSNVPQEPVKNKITIDGLNVDYSNGMLTVSGTNITPTVPDGNNLVGEETPNPTYVFNNIKFVTTSTDLIQAKITYQVAGIYTGEFTGSYIATSFSK